MSILLVGVVGAVGLEIGSRVRYEQSLTRTILLVLVSITEYLSNAVFKRR